MTGFRGITVFILVSAAVFGSFAHHQFTIAQSNENALILAFIAWTQLGIGLVQPEVRHWFRLVSHPTNPPEEFFWARSRLIQMGIGVIWMIVTFALAWGAEFTWPLVIVWLGGICYWWVILSEQAEQAESVPRRMRVPRRVRIAAVAIPVNVDFVLFIVITLVGAFSLTYQLDVAPRQMIPDHAEKIFDLIRMEDGLHSTYFGANSGREPVHFYLSFATSRLYGLSYLSLKYASAINALMLLFALYVLGRTVDGRLTGLFTMAIGGLSAWFLIVGRSGFRAGTAALAAALLLAVLWRAVHSGKRADFLLTGVALGFGLYGYTSFRMAPLIVILGVGLYLLNQPRDQWRRVFMNFAALVLIALMVYIPLFSYWMRYPEVYWYRSQVMAGTDFISNVQLLIAGFVQSITMFNSRQDPVTLNVVPGWGALGPLVGVMWVYGLVLWLWRVANTRRWVEGLLPLAFIVSILPSALGISAPNELPSVRRGIMALPIVMLFAGIGVSFLVQAVLSLRPHWVMRPLVVAGCGVFFTFLAALNWGAYFADYVDLQNLSTGNQTNVYEQIVQFERIGGNRENVHLIFRSDNIWADTEIISLNLGSENTWDNVLVYHPDVDLCRIRPDFNDEPMLFLYPLDDLIVNAELTRCFPDGVRYVWHNIDGRAIFRAMYIPAEVG